MWPRRQNRFFWRRAIFRTRRLIGKAAAVQPEELRTHRERLYSAWVRHFAAFEAWLANDVDNTAALLTDLSASHRHDDVWLEANGLHWLSLGRVAEAEKAFARMSLDSHRYELLAHAALARGDRDTARRVLREDASLFNAAARPPGGGSLAR